MGTKDTLKLLILNTLKRVLKIKSIVTDSNIPANGYKKCHQWYSTRTLTALEE
jgi:hypothetical protein